ncbi:hypothetical protein SRABI27_01641 [Pedobacter sp. Bi27]|uniref:DoxX-like family protein n=1 Tax=unclassified Pedobacter TaxID=2628915 RepID=UPI001D36EFD5|nr:MULTISPECIES: DoxX-like family protein [unclassified Pedobacter]CAH0172766.1 hypothetical protein SRABI36_01303 [Pedobacter sp. Bi36]CAH0196791.1 hypothetical protein SRABI27_01641 [Pedobacter sp. Bi27]CAH0228489.1 hypothetical protein SRABI126_02396 [Pedobacter sp. Bi126]
MVNVINRNNQLLPQRILTSFIALVWLVNGLLCKVLGLVPRHEQIVARILTPTYSHTFTILIGISEIVMAIWILSNFKTKLNALVQIVIVATMNTIEFILAPDLLLWGKFNSLFAFMFILVVFINGFSFNKKTTQQA